MSALHGGGMFIMLTLNRAKIRIQEGGVYEWGLFGVGKGGGG